MVEPQLNSHSINKALDVKTVFLGRALRVFEEYLSGISEKVTLFLVYFKRAD
jgi:hypothetical protein